MKNFYPNISELTEITETTELEPPAPGMPLPDAAVMPRGWIFYDGECRYCIAAAKKSAQIFGRRGFTFLPLQTPWVQRPLDLVPGQPLKEMRVLTSDGRDFGGADALLFLARQVWWLRPLAFAGQLRGIHGAVDAAYRWIAARRGCTHLTGSGEVCRVPLNNRTQSTRTKFVDRPITGWIALVILPLVAISLRTSVAPWVFMWIMAGAIFLGCKWLTLCRAKRRGSAARLPQMLAYLFLWAGMDAENFLASRGRGHRVQHALPKVGLAAGKIALGAVLIFGVARAARSELVAGWIGMIGIILILHFGVFELAAIGWRMFGIAARPIMDAPLQSTSLTEFWGRRWNGAFNQLVRDVFFRRFARSFGTISATLTAFLISGLIHELVISLPAGAGYGLPTSYFLLQGWGIVVQRTPGKRWHLSQGTRGWLFTMLITVAPAFWLFHPPFVQRVIIPFLQAIHAL
jgi:predicted DCC family thiol-disulfide oxidoreductase YuxK